MQKFISILTVAGFAFAVAARGRTTTERAAAGGVAAGPVGAGTGAGVSKAAGDK